MSTSGFPVFDTDHIFLGYRGIGRDVTEQKNAEDALHQARNEADKAEPKFLSSMSPELRTPLNAILGFSQMLELNPKTPLTESQKVSVSYISKGGITY